MRSIALENLLDLQAKPDRIRNICVLAHVDHGKTTLADCLVASNGVISNRMIGQMRYMDSLPEEQERGITMKSSAIALHYADEGMPYLINLIDSPGHVDFCGEVSTATRLCDGALVVVDCVEGVCPQTTAVLRHALTEGLTPILVLNKMDRLILELKLTPLDIYKHLRLVLERVNAVVGEFFTSKMMEMNEKCGQNLIGHVISTDKRRQSQSDRADTVNDNRTPENTGNVESEYDLMMNGDDEHFYFTPSNGNVVFASAIDGWGFRVEDFARIWSTRAKINEKILAETLWGDYYMDEKTKRVKRGAEQNAKKPLFVKMVLENVFLVYDSLIHNNERRLVEKMVTSFQLNVAGRDAVHKDPRVYLRAVFQQWLPLSSAVLRTVCRKVLAPNLLSLERAEHFLAARHFGATTISAEKAIPLDETTTISDPEKLMSREKDDDLKWSRLLTQCSTNPEDPVIVFVSKLFVVETRQLHSSDHSTNREKRPIATAPLTVEEIAEKKRLIQERKHHQAVVRFDEQVEKITIPNNNEEDKLPPLSEQFTLLAFARVFSGCLRPGIRLHVLRPPLLNSASQSATATLGHVTLTDAADSSPVEDNVVVEIGQMYLMMGRELTEISLCPAGNIVALGGLGDSLPSKSVTLSSDPHCPPFNDLRFYAEPIVRVHLEPKRLADLPELIKAMKLLSRSDPLVKTYVEDTGQLVLAAAGEVHLRRCLDDLTKRYSNLELNVSEPIVPFAETIVERPKLTDSAAQTSNQPITNELVEVRTANKQICIKIKAAPLPQSVISILDSNESTLNLIDCILYNSETLIGSAEQIVVDLTRLTDRVQKLRQSLTESFDNAGKRWRRAACLIWSFGPKKARCNVLFNKIPDYQHRPNVWRLVSEKIAAIDKKSRDVIICHQQKSRDLENDQQCDTDKSYDTTSTIIDNDDTQLDNITQNYANLLRECDQSFINGFRFRCRVGPLCEETMRGVGFFVEEWKRAVQDDPVTHAQLDVDHVTQNIVGSRDDAATDLASTSSRDSYGPLSGQMVAAVKEGCKLAFQAQPQRLMAAMYACVIRCSTDVLGRVYAVLNKRGGKVMGEEMNEGTNLFEISAALPVVESFGFCDEIRKRTSGLASPQLVFSHWEVVDIDPFWVPTTQDELEHFGVKADSENRALRYMNTVRKRKGLPVEEKVVESAEKQRTLMKK